MIALTPKTRVYDALVKKSPFAARLFDRTFYHPTRTQEPPTSILINDLNQYWRIQLGSLNVDTVDARSALIDTGDFEQWFGLFTQYVLPVAITSWVDACNGGR